MSRDRHLRLQTTLGLDRQTAMNLSEEFHSPLVVDGNQARIQRKVARHRTVAEDIAVNGQKTKTAREGTAAAADAGNFHLMSVLETN